MNRYSKEIQEALDKLCENYKIKRGILLMEEEDPEEESQRYRTIVFSPVDKKFDASIFAKVFYYCMQNSHSFQRIIDKVSEMSVMGLLKEIHIAEKLHNHENQKAD